MSPPPGSPSYRVSGNQILTSNGRPILPFGVTVFGLSESDWQDNVAGDDAQIAATAGPWHGNTVRIQVAPSILLDASPYDSAFLSTLDREVALAETDGLNVILSAQYERTTKLAMPDQTTVEFWQLIGSHYRDDPRVWFDLFNEPQLGINRAGGIDQLWNIWRNGGNGFTGMQAVLDTVRSVSAPNIVLVEGVEGGESLGELPAHLLSGPNVAYAVHPYFKGPDWSNPTSWDSNWGLVSAQVPVVADEWGEFQRSDGSCVPNAPTLVPTFLEYLSSHHIGLIAWALIPGVLIRGTNLADPTAFDAGVTYTCDKAAGDSPDAQGAGALVQAYFAANSEPVF